MKAKITRKSTEARDIVSFELASIDGTPLPPFAAGAHIDVTIAPGLIRQYSLCNDPAEDHRYTICVLRDAASRGGSIAMHEQIGEGDTIEISAPKNHFPLVPASESLLFAGGIGITPILCMAERLAATGADFTLHYCARSPERAAFVERIRASSFAKRVRFHFSDADQARIDLDAALCEGGAEKHVYACGPNGFIDAVVEKARAAGMPDDRIHVEHFGAALSVQEGDQPFQVRIASSGATYDIPRERTVTQVLAENGIEIPLSCEQGVCGTCVTRLLDGMPDHRDMYFTDDEHARNDQFTPCCSRAKTKLLVLDI